jgi:hypothetical protein
MRRFALGCLNYTAERFGLTLVGDMLDAMAGFNEAETNRIKKLAVVVRDSTTILWNIQVDKEHRLEPSQLWRFPWEIEDEEDSGIDVQPLSEEQVKQMEDEFDRVLQTRQKNKS